jgi:hypothetical protein
MSLLWHEAAVLAVDTSVRNAGLSRGAASVFACVPI